MMSALASTPSIRGDHLGAADVRPGIPGTAYDTPDYTEAQVKSTWCPVSTT